MLVCAQQPAQAQLYGGDSVTVYSIDTPAGVPAAIPLTPVSLHRPGAMPETGLTPVTLRNPAPEQPAPPVPAFSMPAGYAASSAPLHPVTLTPPPAQAAPAAQPFPAVLHPPSSEAQAELTPVALHPSAQWNRLATRPGIELGIDYSRYRYSEPGFAELRGDKGGIEATGTMALNDFQDVFLRGEGRYAYGKNHYSSDQGGECCIPDTIWEGRALIGKDFLGSEFSISPYTGFGYRYLYDDSRGASTSGAQGYRRYSHYYYVPVGFTQRIGLPAGARLSTNAEFDWLASGYQISKLTDFGFPVDANNYQRHGYGARGSVMLEAGNWSVGPWINYWHIANSAFDPFFVGIEPNNITEEAGVKLMRSF